MVSVNRSFQEDRIVEKSKIGSIVIAVLVGIGLLWVLGKILGFVLSIGLWLLFGVVVGGVIYLGYRKFNKMLTSGKRLT